MQPQPTDAVVCLITAPPADAHSIASTVIEEKLAACVNLVPLIQSIYWWEGKVAHGDESLLVVKTTRRKVTCLEERLRAIHPYENFELISLDITSGSPAYIEWIACSVNRAD
jgi:periplasmic divalent cation tolerance protein